MKKRVIVTLITLLMMSLFLNITLFAQTDSTTAAKDTAQVAQDSTKNIAPVAENNAQMGTFETLARKLVGSYLVDLFIAGGWVMWPMLVLMLWGFAIVVWKLVAFGYAKINLNQFLGKIVPLVEAGKIKEAMAICEKTKGPVANILFAGLSKFDQGEAAINLAIENASNAEMAFLEWGFIHMSTTINLGPMFGFFGTIVGMVDAFDAIAKAGEVDPTIVAAGIKVALITTEYGLAIGIPVQFFNNLLLSQVDGFVQDMQKATEKLIELVNEK